MNAVNALSPQSNVYQTYASSTSAVASSEELKTDVKASESYSRLENSQVTISAEGRDKLAQEKSELGKTLAEQLQQNNKDEVEEQSDNSEAQYLDKMIEQVKEQLKETQREISALNNDSSVEAKEKQEALEAQLISLNATLMGLMGKKMAAMEEAAK